MTRKEIEELVAREFLRGDPRSPEYRRGTIELICFKETGSGFTKPYAMGTVQADAYWAGVDRGWAIWNRLQDACRGAVVAQ